jgi:hypothetical protein|tara:strand:- start:384 stop:584 length:201 start_codon:yes stop_codon:yes gene_type:complete
MKGECMSDLTILKSLYKKLYDARNSLHIIRMEGNYDLDNRVEEVDTKLSEIKEELEEEFNKNSERI